MAIVVEEEKKNGGILGLLTWVMVIGILGAATYYIFFRNPEIVPIPTPQSFEDTAALSKLQIDSVQTQKIIDSIKPLSHYVLPAPQSVGRTNPFLGF